MAKTDTNELTQYLATGWQLIPLHAHDFYDMQKGKKRERGKSPFHPNWTKRPYVSKEQIAHMKKGSNVGVRLRAEDLVVDVDPRNFKEGDDPLARLCTDCGINPDLYPTVETGSGGLHIYMKKPTDVSVRDSLSDYEGVEFKTLGRQVVSAGSIHPTTKKTYVWDFCRPELAEVSEAPTRLLHVIRRPSMALATGGGEHGQEELAMMLEVLDPEDFQDHDKWFTLMQACHHATAGDGRSEFIEWCTRDPVYQDQGGIIGRRWDSMHADNATGNRVTFRTLHMLLREADQEAAIPRTTATDDFDVVGPDDIPEDGFVEEHEKLGPLERLNKDYWAVMDGGQFKVFWEEIDPETAIPHKNIDPRKRWVKAKLYDVKSMMANRKVQSGKKAVPLIDAWMEWGGRRSARGVVFDPEHDHEGFLNLWTGWGYEPRKGGEWGRLNELLFEVLCDGDEAVMKYVLDWAAYMVQHPGRPAEVAICFQGGKGVGKGTWGRTLASLAGKHGMQITSSDQLTGRFNDHLRDMILLFADEALKPYDKDGESRLKGLITEPRIAYEGKGRDVVSGLNRLHIVMASNEDWFVPVGLDGERRFMVAQASDSKRGQHAWFQKLNDELDGGGYAGLLWDLLHRDITGWAPRKGIPSTNAMVDQKIRNLTPMAQWWFNTLMEGELDFPLARDELKWSDKSVRAFKQDIRESFNQHCRMNGIRSAGAMGRSIETMFTTELVKYVPGLKYRVKDVVPDDRPEIKCHSDGRAWAMDIPCLDECREAFEQLLGTTVKWAENEDDDVDF